MPPGHEGRDQEFQDAGRSIKKYFRELNELVPQLPYGAITSIASAFLDAFTEQRTVYVFGNGGSASSASHMMCDMNKGASGLSAGNVRAEWALQTMVSLSA